MFVFDVFLGNHPKLSTAPPCEERAHPTRGYPQVHCPAEGLTTFTGRAGAGDDYVWVADLSLPGDVELGPGNDDSWDGPLADRVSGGEGDDKWLNGGGPDFFDGGPGADILFIGPGGLVNGNDEIHGGDGDDNMWAGGGNDRVYGDAGNETLHGNPGDDTVEGGDGDDLLGALPPIFPWGPRKICAQDPGDDVLDGGAGDDGVCGGSGVDVVRGGDGNDRIDTLDEVRDEVVSCGTGLDLLNADAFDPVDPDCEQAYFGEHVYLHPDGAPATLTPAGGSPIAVSASGRLPVPFRCQSNRCSGTISMALRAPGVASVSARRRIATKRFTVRRGSENLSVPLTRDAVRRLRRVRRPSLEVEVTGAAGAKITFLLRGRFRVVSPARH